MMDADGIDGEATLTGAELFHYLSKKNEQQLQYTRRKLQEYTKVQDVLQSLTDRCRVPVLAPVAGGMAYFEATMDYTNNILVLLGDSWFAERSAKQAHEIAGRRLDFLRREESALVAEAEALMQRQSLFLAEVPDAERAMSEVEALKTDCLQGQRRRDDKKQGDEKPEKKEKKKAEETALGPELWDDDMAVIDELDQLTEAELLEIERELGERIEDDELVERVMTERIIAKKERRVRETLGRERRPSEAQPPTAAGGQKEKENKENKEEECAIVSAPTFATPGDIGRVAAVAPNGTSPEKTKESIDARGSLERRVKFSDVVGVVLPEERPATRHVVGDVVEHDPTATHTVAPTSTAAAPKKRKSLFRTELEQDMR